MTAKKNRHLVDGGLVGATQSGAINAIMMFLDSHFHRSGVFYAIMVPVFVAHFFVVLDCNNSHYPYENSKQRQCNI